MSWRCEASLLVKANATRFTKFTFLLILCKLTPKHILRCELWGKFSNWSRHRCCRRHDVSQNLLVVLVTARISVLDGRVQSPVILSTAGWCDQNIVITIRYSVHNMNIFSWTNLLGIVWFWGFFCKLLMKTYFVYIVSLDLTG